MSTRQTWVNSLILRMEQSNEINKKTEARTVSQSLYYALCVMESKLRGFLRLFCSCTHGGDTAVQGGIREVKIRKGQGLCQPVKSPCRQFPCQFPADKMNGRVDFLILMPAPGSCLRRAFASEEYPRRCRRRAQRRSETLSQGAGIGKTPHADTDRRGCLQSRGYRFQP